MATEIAMPQLSDTMHEGKILTWKKKIGDSVKRGDCLAEVATDKADLEIESFYEGTLIQINASEGETVKVGSIIAVIGAAGETASSTPSSSNTTPTTIVTTSPATPSSPTTATSSLQISAESTNTVQQTSNVATTFNAQSNTVANHSNANDAERIKISPLAKNIASSHSVDYSSLKGTGEGGRIVKRDIESALESSGSNSSTQSSNTATTTATKTVAPTIQLGTSEPLSKMRQTIAERMVISKTTIPHFYVTSKITVDALSKMRESLKKLPEYEGVTYNHLIIKASALALKKYPRINSALANDKLVQPSDINIGIVTAVPDGLLIPVLKNADATPLSEIVTTSRGLIQRARAMKPKGDDLSGGTFSISNMGMFAVESFSAIISPGQGAILAVSSINEEPVVVDGQVKAGKVMRVTLSVDHRIIDGVLAGEFVTELKRLVEDPVLLLA